MADTPVNLHALALIEIQRATERLTNGGSVDAWERDMARIIAREHTAALIAGTAERAGVPVNEGLFKGLSRAERADLKRTVQEQLRYLAGFAEGIRQGKQTPAQIAARANLYAGPLRATYSKAKFPGLPFYPTEGSECMANCKCHWEQTNGGFNWIMGTAEHCGTCQSRAADNPYVIEAVAA